MKVGWHLRAWGPYLALAGQNVLIFSQHYRGAASFPWDFPMSYHAAPFYWIASLQVGIFPEWVPFQAMGYPLPMNLQSALFYLPLWIFVPLGLRYSLEAATVVQCLHVLAGGVGMYRLARGYHLARPYALFAAAGYQCFGAFYSNAEHADIIRGLALLPWLMYGLRTPDAVERPDVLRGLVTVPVVTVLLWTGAYPGLTLAALVVGAVHVGLELAQRPRNWRGKSQWALVSLIGVLIGTGMALVHLLPAFALRHELARHALSDEHGRTFLAWDHLLTLVFPYDLPTLGSIDISMRSVFVTAPVVCLLAFLQARTVRRFWPWLVTATFSVLVLTGTPVYWGLVTLLPPLRLSTATASDYRGFVGISLVLLAAAALRDLVRDPQPMRTTAPWRLGAVLGFLLLGALRLPALSTTQLAILLGPAVGAFLVLLGFVYRPWPRALLGGALALLLLIHGVAYHRALGRPWSDPDVTAWHARTCGYQPPLSEHRLKLALTQTPAGRPPREPPVHKHHCPWKGYLFGSYHPDDKSGGTQLSRVRHGLEDPILRVLMAAESRALLVSDGRAVTPQDLEDFSKARFAANGEGVRLLAYAPSGLTYRVSLTAPALMIENEMYFPGWAARLEGTSGGQRLQALEVAQALRAWRLPAGQYLLRTEFRMPYLRLGAILSLLTAGLWVIGIVWGVSRSHQAKMAMATRH